jgi:YfiH family protein
MLTGSLGAPPSVRYAFTDRRGGLSEPPYDDLNLAAHVGDTPDAVAENRRRVAAGLGLPADRLVFMEQVHGGEVVVVDGPVAGPAPRCDGLVTSATGLALAVLVADCVPVLLADPAAGVVAAVHAGRRGIRSGVVSRAVDVMVSRGATPSRTAARLGPAVCGACYEVPAAMQAEVLDVVPRARATTPRGTPALDLREGVSDQLRSLGVDDVALVGPCTREDPAQFSHRRDGTTGRAAGFVWRTSWRS